MKDVANSSDAAGYGRPPASTRFRKGESGNPRGRPPVRKHELPYEAVLGQMVTIQENDRKYQVSAIVKPSHIVGWTARETLLAGAPIVRSGGSPPPGDPAVTEFPGRSFFGERKDRHRCLRG